ncbi:MAG: HDIG domain-containing protein [Flavobacteriaceae bacterium]|nr:HDIG domain-containing protein [Flavobacteriaceae bacterium]
MKNVLNKIFENHSLIYKLFLYITATVLVVYLFPKGGQFKYEFQKGKPWQFENYYAPFDFAVQKTPETIAAEKLAIEKNGKQYFAYDNGIAIRVKSDFSAAVNKYLKGSSVGVEIQKELQGRSEELIHHIYEYGLIDSESAEKILDQGRIIALRNGNEIRDIVPSKFSYEGKLLAVVERFFKVAALSKQEGEIVSILSSLLQPNVSFDVKFTQRELTESLKKISYTTGLVAENERIIFKGDIVEGKKLAVLNSIKNEFESQVWSTSNYNWIVFGYTILVALAFLMLLLFLRKYRTEIYEDNNKVTFIFFNVILMVLLITVVVKYDAKYVYIVPLVILPLVLKAFFDARLGLFTHVLTVLLLGFIVPNSFEFIFLQIIAGIVTILTISELYKRANLFISVAQITLVYFIAYFAFTIIQEGNAQSLTENYDNFIYFIINGALALFVLPLIYVFEKLFSLVSDESLKELSNTNSKLLRELSEKAPGTFNHSLQVANLAEACANEIGANSMLVRTGALYHDIGKMNNPMYYTENQSTNVNPHNELSPKDSAQIIINHVIAGVELAKKHRLPDRIIDFIRTHHGTSVVYYFYKMEEKENPEGLRREDFQYPGPIPFSKETAILMMCDASEAASKSIKEPTAELFDNLIDKIISKQMDDGQFINADITFKELLTVKKVLKKKLKNIYHLRIEYPE